MLYASYDIPHSTSHRLWTWDFLQLIKYYRSPYSILISTTINHKLQLTNILHPFIWMNSWLHLSPWRLSYRIMPFKKTLSPYVPHTTPYGRNNMCLTSLSSIFKICMSNIRFQYGVFVSPTYSSPFSELSFVWFSITCQFASKSNYHCKFWVTIQFILFHNSLSLKFVNRYIILMALTIDL